jgi:hypothetical protein
MAEFNGVQVEQDHFNAAVRLRDERLALATPVELLTRTGGKLLEIVEEPDGRQFVRRSFGDDAVSDMEIMSELEFPAAWREMHQLFTGNNVRPVSSSLIKKDGYYPFVAVSELVQDGVTLDQAPTEAKKDVVCVLGAAMQGPRGYIPSLTMLRADMIQVAPKGDEGYEALLLDVDPRIEPKRTFVSDYQTANSIRWITDLIWDHWGNEDDRSEVAYAFADAIKNIIFQEGNQTIEEFGILHLMAQGFDTREHTLDDRRSTL